jgi:hypothetical protein
VFAASYATPGVLPAAAPGFCPIVAPVCVTSGLSGFNIITDAATSYVDNRWNLAAGDFVGRDRIVGIGIEVHNVTAELTKCGTISCWRLGQGRERMALQTTSVSGVFNETEWITLPQTNNALSLYPDTTTWEAKEGAYLIGVQNHEDNRPSFVQYRKGVIAGADPTYTSQNVGVTNGAIRSFNFDSFGAYLAGLGDDSVLSITVKYFLESFPSADNATYLPLTRPTTEYEPVTLEIYDRAMREMPVAVMVKENPLGEWFDSILSGIENVAPMLSGIPIIGNIANAVKPIASGVRKAMGTKQSKKSQPAAAATQPRK